MTFPDFIESNLESLLAEWVDFARTRLPAAGAMDERQLRDGAEAILRAIAANMRASQTNQEQREKSRGQRPELAPPVTETAELHAAERLGGGFTLDQLVSEYRALRASVVRHWMTDLGAADRNHLDELIRFNEAMDQSLSEAIRWFNSGLERSRSIFVGMLGHDLRDPLNAAMAGTELQLLTDDLGKLREAAERVRRNLRRMSDMIGDLLDFARTRLGERLPVDLSAMGMKEACREVVEAFDMSYQDRELRLDCTGDLTGSWDQDRIKQLLSNLIKNALEHGASDAPVSVSVQGEAGDVVLAVHNEGPPVPREKHHTLFDPLTRGDVQKRPQSRGLGLGLYIVREIAEAHGGRVELDSTEEKGTTVAVRLPRAI